MRETSRISFRRSYLDERLAAFPFRGDVLDVGGKKANAKGAFRPPLEHCRSWRTVNIDATTQPDFLASADALPVADGSADTVLLAETLEHLEFPEKALAEAVRALRPGGWLVLSVPFLFPLHGDPFDFQRWTPEKFRRVLAGLGLTQVEAQPMGGLYAVVADAFEAWCQCHFVEGRTLPLPFRVARRLLRALAWPVLRRRDPELPYRHAVTTGYFVTARKPESPRG